MNKRRLYELDSLTPEQRRKMRQIFFWVLLVYLQFEWFGLMGLRLMIPAAAIGTIALITRDGRPTFLAVHGALLFAMGLDAMRSPSWILFADLAVLGGLTALEHVHRRPGFLLALTIEHALALAFNPWSAFTLMNRPELPLVGSAAVVRLFAIVMLVAVWVRTFLLPPEPAEPEAPKPQGPLTVAQWEARNRKE